MHNKVLNIFIYPHGAKTNEDILHKLAALDSMFKKFLIYSILWWV